MTDQEYAEVRVKHVDAIDGKLREIRDIIGSMYSLSISHRMSLVYETELLNKVGDVEHYIKNAKESWRAKLK